MVVYVTAVEPQDGYRLLVTFENGERRLFDCTELLEKRVYAPLRNKGFFDLVQAEYGTAVWDGCIDIAPEHLYERGVTV